MQTEMAEHIARSTERLLARGLAPDAARREAIREFGNVPYLQEEGRIARGTHGLDALSGDLRFALRHFLRNPLSTLTMVAVLSIGIAINVVLYTVLHSFTDRPPSQVEASDDLVRIRGSQLRDGSRVQRASTLDEVEAYASLQRHFATVAAWTSEPVTAGAPGVEEFTVTATFVTDEYFQVLGVQPLRGRGLVAGDAAQVAVLSHAAWTRSFAQDSGMVGRTITLADVPFTIVGIAPPRFRGAASEARNDMQVWLPLSSHRRVFPEVPNDAALLYAIGRLQPGISREAATAAAKVVAQRITSTQPMDSSDVVSRLSRDPSVEVAPLLADNLEPGAEANARNVTLAFSALGLLILLVTCANVGSLQTGLALARRREIAIRMSLGAHRGRVTRQLLTESLLLSLFAAGGAVAVTSAILRALLMIATFSFELVFDWTAILFAFGVALVAGLLFGLSPALHATRLGVAGVLKDSAASVAGGRAQLQRGLVIAQITLTQPLAVCVAALVSLGIAQYRSNPRNPHGERIVQLRLSSDGARVLTGDSATGSPAAAERERLETERLVDAFRQVPGITHAAFVPNRVPINLEAFTRPDGARQSDEGEAFYLLGRAAMPGYLDLIGTPIVLGRDLGAADTAGFAANAIPIVIGDDMARSLWGDASPIGRRVERAAAKEPMTLEVVGVYKEEVAARGHARNPFTIFVPPDPRLKAQAESRLIMLRVAASAETAMPTIRGIVRNEAQRSVILELRTLAAQQDEERFILRGAIGLFASGGLVALLLCALGLYAVVAFAVGQRTGEIAVRMAIGARARQIVGHFASDGLRLTIIGVVMGLPLSILGLRQLLSVLPGVPEMNLALIMSLVAIGVLAVAGLASWLPASRAAEVDPAVVLRKE
jgi:predicted permease